MDYLSISKKQTLLNKLFKFYYLDTSWPFSTVKGNVSDILYYFALIMLERLHTSFLTSRESSIVLPLIKDDTKLTYLFHLLKMFLFFLLYFKII